MAGQDKSDVFDIKNCRTRSAGLEEFYDCLSPQQAHLCGFSTPFGYVYFCKHPERQKFLASLKLTQDDGALSLDSGESDNE